MDYDEIMKLRFGATPIPEPTGDAGVDKERIVQWLLETAFFCDFVYRNPEGKKKGKELNDASIIYDDVAVIVQVKTHDSSKPIEKWVRKELSHAFKQLKGSYRMIKDRIVIKLTNELLKTEIEIDPEKHKWIYGVVVLVCESPICDPLQNVDRDDIPEFAYHIFSLNDFNTIFRRMDTPGEFLAYYDLRFKARHILKPKLQDEENTMAAMSLLLPDLLGERIKDIPPENQKKTLDLWKRRLTLDANTLPEYEYSLLVDDIIARVHDADENLYTRNEKGRIANQRIAEFFAYIDRERRIALGKRMYDCAKSATDGKGYWFAYCQRAAKRTYVFLYSNDNREDRSKFLMALVIAAQKKYGFPRVLGVATNSLGQGGRAYDFVLLEENIPEDLAKELGAPHEFFKGENESLI